MTEPTGLMLSNSTAAAKLAAAFWLAQLAVILLRRGAIVPQWQIGLSILTVIASTIVWQSQPSTAWFIACVLGLLMLIDGLRQWLSGRTSKPGQTQRWPVVASVLAAIGMLLCTYAILVDRETSNLSTSSRFDAAVIASLLLLFVMFALLLASTLELTFGLTGAELLALPWSLFSKIATFAFLAEVLLAGWVVMKLKPSDSVEMTAAAILYVFSRLLLGYIAWCIPRRMSSLASQKALKGQSSLALSGWICLICFAVAMALPTAWP